MALQAGGTVLAMKVATTVAGSVNDGEAVDILSSTNANPIVVTTDGAHGLTSGMVVTIADHLVNTSANGTWVATVLSSTTFSIPVAGVGVGGKTGTSTWTGTIQSGTGTSAITFTGAAYDQFYILVTIVTGGTVGTTGIQFTVSLDAGRSLNLPRINLGTATTYAIPNTNVTINFQSTKTLVAGDTARCVTTAPAWNASGVNAALAALKASPYANSGWGSMHLVGITAGSDASSFQTTLEGFATDLLYDRLMCEARDASPPTAWGGTGETDSTWSTSVIADFASVEARRIGVAAGYYNMQSAFPNPVAGQPFYRRPLGWAWAARVLQLPTPADHEGWVRLGSLSQVRLNLVTDPTDGFVYHDEQSTGPVFDNLAGGPGRMTAARQRRGKPGWFTTNPLSLAPSGSTFQLFPYCRVIDLASDIIQDVGVDYVNQRVKLNRNGTIREQDANGLETALYAGLDAGIGNLISGRTVAVDRTNNVRSTGTVIVTATIQGDAFVLELRITLAYGTPELGNTP